MEVLTIPQIAKREKEKDREKKNAYIQYNS